MQYFDHAYFFTGLKKAGVDFVVTGAVALNLHGVPRMTYDLDLVVGPEEENFLRAVRQLFKWGYVCDPILEAKEAARPEVRRRLVSEGRAVLRFRNGESDIGEVDVALDAGVPYAELRGRAVEMRLSGLAVPVMALDDLAAAKERMGRPEDVEDMRSIGILKALIAEDKEALASTDQRHDQIRKFMKWSLEMRCEWLLSAGQLRRESGSGQAGRGPARGRSALKRGKKRGLDRYQDLS
jgi:hypothetical protein